MMNCPGCEECRFFDPDLTIEDEKDLKQNKYKPADFGTCHRLPPIRTTEIFGAFPIVQLTDWCAEFQPEEEEAQDDEPIATPYRGKPR